MIKLFRKIRQNLLNEGKTSKYFKYAIGEIILVVIGILIALQINNWNENRKNKIIETKILSEISNGLKQDLADIKVNIKGHESGIKAVEYWRRVVENKKVNNDSLLFSYHYITRDFLSAQNTSGYESLKSKGLEYIHSDSIRVKIISIYEQDYAFLKKLEEEYEESQFQKNYFKEINAIISPHLIFDSSGNPRFIKHPVNINATDKNLLLSYLWKIKSNREFVLKQYHLTEDNVNSLINLIDNKLKD